MLEIRAEHQYSSSLRISTAPLSYRVVENVSPPGEQQSIQM